MDRNCVAKVTSSPMRMSARFSSWRARFLERPGATVDLAPMRAALPVAGKREPALAKLSDAELTAKAVAWRAEAASVPPAKRKKKLTGRLDARAELCALGREAARRGLGLRPYDVQLIGAQALLAGHVVEMATGEGKTLVAAIAASGLAAHGRVHVLTINDYLA